ATLTVSRPAQTPTPTPTPTPTDTTAPSIVVSAPGPGLVTRSDPTISGQVTDVDSGVETLTEQLDNTAVVSVPFDASRGFPLETQLPVDASADGAHILHLRAVDRSGNATSVDVAFTLDTIAPAMPSFDLDPSSQSTPGSDATTFATVTLNGQTDPRTSVTLVQ